MRILIVEDNTTRIQMFQRKFCMHELTFKEDAESSILALIKNKYDIIMLDHDLGGGQYVDSNEENTGYTVAKFIRNVGIDSNVIVHSLNSIGAKNILSILPEAIYCPGIWLDMEFTDFDLVRDIQKIKEVNK